MLSAQTTLISHIYVNGTHLQMSGRSVLYKTVHIKTEQDCIHAHTHRDKLHT